VRKTLIFLVIMMVFQLFAQTDMPEVYYNVSVTGAVEFPGVYHLPPTSRLSEAIMLSRGVIAGQQLPTELDVAELEKELTINDVVLKNSEQYDLEEEEELEISLRNITLKRKGDIIAIDLQKFLLLGDNTQNPFLMDGDVIHVPASITKVTILGEVINPGAYEILPEDRISDLILFAFGVKESALLENVEVIRYNTEKKVQTLNIDLSKVLVDDSCEDNLILQTGDRIYIRAIPDYMKHDEVTVLGEVKFPGTYIIDDETTLSQLISRSGAFTTTADLTNSFLQRRSMELDFDAEFERLKYIDPTEMTYFEYEYFKTKISELKGKFSLDFQIYNQSEVPGKDIVLQDGDFVYISTKINAVIVSGQVKQPGLITFIPGMTIDFYIDQAGGFGWNANKCKIRVIRADSGEWLKPEKDLILQEGDTILIPHRPDWNYWEIFKDAVVILSQIATIYLVVQNVK